MYCMFLGSCTVGVIKMFPYSLRFVFGERTQKGRRTNAKRMFVIFHLQFQVPHVADACF